jgi:hypothetical protein
VVAYGCGQILAAQALLVGDGLIFRHLFRAHSSAPLPPLVHHDSGSLSQGHDSDSLSAPSPASLPESYGTGLHGPHATGFGGRNRKAQSLRLNTVFATEYSGRLS